MVKFDELRRSLKALEGQHRNRQELGSSPPELVQEALAESVIRRFEVCYDCLWKVLRLYLIHELGLVKVRNSPKATIRTANEQELLASPAELWIGYADARIATSHDYDVDKAKDCLKVIPCFIDDVIDLYQRMTGTTWE